MKQEIKARQLWKHATALLLVAQTVFGNRGRQTVDIPPSAEKTTNTFMPTTESGVNESFNIMQMLAFNTDKRLREITDFSRQSLEESIEGSVEVMSASLLDAKAFNKKEYKSLRILAESNRTEDASRIIFGTVLEKGSREERIIWTILFQLQNVIPKLRESLVMTQQRFPDAGMQVKENSDTKFLQILATWTDIELHRATTFYRLTIEQSIEEFVEKVSHSVLNATAFTKTDYKKIGMLTDRNRTNDASQAFLDILLIKGAHSERMLWQELFQLQNIKPKLKAAFVELQTEERGTFMNAQEEKCDFCQPEEKRDTSVKRNTNAEILQMLASNTDAQLRRITDFSRDRLQKAIEEFGDTANAFLWNENVFNKSDYEIIKAQSQIQARCDTSRLIFDTLMGKGAQGERQFWILLPKLQDSSHKQKGTVPDTGRSILIENYLKETSDAIILQMVARYTDNQLRRFTDFYRHTLEETIEDYVEEVRRHLSRANVFTKIDQKRITKIAESHSSNEVSKAIVDIMLEKKAPGERVMWNTLFQLQKVKPRIKATLSKIKNIVLEDIVIMREQCRTLLAYSIMATFLLGALLEVITLFLWPMGSQGKFWQTRENIANRIRHNNKAAGISNTTVLLMLPTYTDAELRKLTYDHRFKLVKSIEKHVEAVSRSLLDACVFTEREHKEICNLAEKNFTSDATEMIFDIVLESGAKGGRTMWNIFTKMQTSIRELKNILSEIGDKGSKFQAESMWNRFSPEVVNRIHEAEFKHKEHILGQTKRLAAIINGRKGYHGTYLLDDNFTNIIIAASPRERSLVEYEAQAQGRMRVEIQQENIQKLKLFQLDELFSSTCCKERPTETTVIIGAAGIGKSTLIQKMIREWARMKIYKQFAFVFHFKFLELNLITVRTNLTNLISDSYPYLANVLQHLWQEPAKLLFVIDDFDRVEQAIQFTDDKNSNEEQKDYLDPECYCEVSEIVRCLVQGQLLAGCSVLITTRPWQLELLEKTNKKRTVEILGFGVEQIDQYFRQCYEDKQFAAEVTEYIKRNEPLYTMCYNPLYCSVLFLLFASYLPQATERRPFAEITNTKAVCAYVTSLLARNGSDRGNATPTLLKIGEMAFQGICNQKFVFMRPQLNQHELNFPNITSAFMMEIRDRDRNRNVCMFTHSILQHFASAFVKSKMTQGNELIRLLSEWNLCRDGRFTKASCFLVGLSSLNSTDQFEGKMFKFSTEASKYVTDWLKENVKTYVQNLEDGNSQRKLLNILHYIFELGDSGLMTAALTPISRVKFRNCHLTSTDCFVLSAAMMNAERIEELDLSACTIQAEGIHQLKRLLSKCKIFRLKSNNLADDCVEMLISSLKGNCTLEELDLSNDDLYEDRANRLTDKSVTALKRLLQSSANLKEIRMSHNNCLLKDRTI
ncbi:uncharacterized protein [Scyliorhinus torazame]|uniref:uncharacterized protein n=1 Tax=Scyliorhinus torazame TaxID=75743 RepID=UPI003B59467E